MRFCNIPLSSVTTNNNKLDIEKMKPKSDVCTFGLSIGLTLDKRNSLDNLRATIYNYLKKTKEHYYKTSWTRICFSYLISNQCLNLRLFPSMIMVQSLLPVQPLIELWKWSSPLMGRLLIHFSIDKNFIIITSYLKLKSRYWEW